MEQPPNTSASASAKMRYVCNNPECRAYRTVLEADELMCHDQVTCSTEEDGDKYCCYCDSLAVREEDAAAQQAQEINEQQ